MAGRPAGLIEKILPLGEFVNNPLEHFSLVPTLRVSLGTRETEENE